ncbi:MAG: hypothetical protein ABJR05_11125 [Balneola sp.]
MSTAKAKDHSYSPERDVHRITLYNTVYPEHLHVGLKARLYLHFDFACFYAQVEMLRKRMYGLPLIIGGWRKEDGTAKGIVATSSYEARAFGIKTGMSALEAVQICPYVCMLQVDYDAYIAISKQVHHIFKKHCHRVERYSMDEYFMDLTFLVDKSDKEVLTFSKRIQQEIFETTGLYGSLGIARSKTYAKLSSSLDKPKGISIIRTDDDEKAYIHPLPVNKVWGVGGRRYQHILNEGFQTIGDVVGGNVKTFQRLFGSNFGEMLYWTITGKERARVLEENDNYKPKHGVSYGHTFSEGSHDLQRIKGEFAIAISQICYRMRAYGIRANNYSGMFGYNEYENRSANNVSFRFVTNMYTNIDEYVYEALMEKIEPALIKACEYKMEIRNLVIGTHQIDKTNQINLFFSDEPKHSKRWKAIDEIRNRFGHKYITKANSLHRVTGNTHFLERNG